MLPLGSFVVLASSQNSRPACTRPSPQIVHAPGSAAPAPVPHAPPGHCELTPLRACVSQASPSFPPPLQVVPLRHSLAIPTGQVGHSCGSTSGTEPGGVVSQVTPVSPTRTVPSPQ